VQKTSDKVYFELILTSNAGRWTVTKRNKSVIQAMDVILFGKY
jgi:hypothetical protein